MTSIAARIQGVLDERAERPVHPILGFLIFVIPAIFVWFLLRDGHSTRSRIIGFAWAILVQFGILSGFLA